MKPSVVVSAMAIDSLLGTTLPEVVQSLRAGHTDFFVDPWLVERQAKSPIRSGWYKKPLYEAPELVEGHRTLLRNLSSETLQPLRLLRPLVEDGRLTPAELQSPRTGVIAAALQSNHTLSQKHAAAMREDAPRPFKTLGSTAIQQAQASGVANAVSILLGTRGVCFAVETACSTAAYAMALAKMLIESGAQDRVIVIASQTHSWVHAVFDPLHALSQRTDSPMTASRPFDRGRDGVVLGGGMAAVLLEARAAAEKRGAPLYCELAGAALGSDGEDWTNPSGVGSVEVMRAALADARMQPSEIDYVNAHGTSTPVGDLLEAQAIARVFEGRPVPVSSTKSQEGHLVFAAALTELIYSVLMMREGFIAPTINVTEPDPALPPGFDLVTTLRQRRIRAFLKSSYGFGGTNACLIGRSIA
jgi:3-oxoacyl-[acyl-carrier-protein] synthase-1